MKSRFVFLASAAILSLIGATNRSEAQQFGVRPPPQYGPGYSAPLSPYLNLLRGGDISANYFLGVQPEFQRRDDRFELLTRTRELEGRANQLENPTEFEPLVGGTPAGFGDTRSYFSEPGTYYQTVRPGGIGQGRPQPGVRRTP
jgi:hypothetical protein